MSIAEETLDIAAGTEISIESPGSLTALAGALAEWFGVDFSVIDAVSGRLLQMAEDQPAADWSLRTELSREIARRGRVEIIEDEEPLAVLAIPKVQRDGSGMVALATFVTRPLLASDDLAAASATLGLSAAQTRKWISRQTVWPHDVLVRMGQLALAKLTAEERSRRLEDEVSSLSQNIAATYEEISLLYRVTQNLKISASDEELGRMTLRWLDEILPAEGMALLLWPLVEEESPGQNIRSQSVLLTQGDCPVTQEQFQEMIDALGLRQLSRPYVVNPPITEQASWKFPAVRELIVVPLAEGDNVFGHFAAFNHQTPGAQFGTVEASLMSSIGVILGIHSGNLELYRQQAELLAGVVRALTSAIDAKDPYTCGHSNRVARVAVRIAQQLGLENNTVRTLYLSGLLHDVGKIGIDDQVLRKPGRLTEAEYEHIKMHPDLGYRILIGLRQLDNVLPVVLHHHEQFNGKGYPHGLAGDEIPLLARIVAVADSFDAMGSDRPYRKGMPEEKLDAILKAGAGSQWDPTVIDAFFQARDDIRTIAQKERDSLVLDVQQWT